ncbi:GumC family protein [Tunicatimonas pelagia]|uniref:GumC family protein n=1 Tax=Tunicatimonas pelagia TaxID=931531 RepID=UPI0026661EF6|nr:tyrosine-protein kinase family protein [Tunicatimonas pelagia]WKN40433.1 polysaccharide biosynthesis tyrosine autokinase [Tunicatimonas pelagia]
MKETTEEEFIDIRKVLLKSVDKWYYFLIGLALCFTIAILYLKTAPKQYEVEATVLLKDQGLSDRSSGQEKFINGLDLLSGNSELADEIAILSSYAMVQRALEQLDFTVSYFQYPDTWGFLGEQMEEEIYHSKFEAILDYKEPQLIGVPIYISFPDPKHYRIQVDADEATLFDVANQQVVQPEVEAKMDETLPINQPYESPLLSFQLVLDSSYVVEEDQQFYIIVNTLQGLTKSYSGKLGITPISEESSIVQLTTKGRIPQKEKAFLNTLAEVYIQHDLNKKNELGLRAIGFIDTQLATVYDSLQSVEGNLESFRASNQIIDISTTSESLNAQLQQLEAEQAKLGVQREYYQYTSEYLRNNEDVTDVVAPSAVGINDPLLNNLLQDLSIMNQEKVEKAYSSGENNPVLRVLENKIRSTKAALIENIDNLISSNRIASQENQRRINRLEGQVNNLPQSERNLINIQRKFALNSNIYNYLLEKRAEAGIALASNLPNKSMVDTPRLIGSTATEPNKSLVFFLAFLAGIVLPLGLVTAQHLLNTKVNDSADLNITPTIPVIGSIPRAARGQKLPVLAPSSPVAEAFRFLRITLDRQWLRQDTQPIVIGVTSAQAGDGKTFCAANLAAAYARVGKKTLLIGADLRKPRLQEYFNVKDFGLAEYLGQEADFTTVLQNTDLPHLSVLSAGKATSDIALLIESDNCTKKLIQEAKAQFDVIIFDTPPIGIVADAFVLSPYMDIFIHLIRYNHTNKAQIAKLDSLFESKDMKNLVVVVNDSRRDESYGYSYDYNPDLNKN